MKNYSKEMPQDKAGLPIQMSPAPFAALQRMANENASTSSVITASQDATVVEVAAVGAAAIMRWVTTSDTQASVIGVAGATANYDHVIPKDTFRRFTIPIESNPATGYSSMLGANRANGLYQRYAVKAQGVASVLTSEY